MDSVSGAGGSAWWAREHSCCLAGHGLEVPKLLGERHGQLRRRFVVVGVSCNVALGSTSSTLDPDTICNEFLIRDNGKEREYGEAETREVALSPLPSTPWFEQ